MGTRTTARNVCVHHVRAGCQQPTLLQTLFVCTTSQVLPGLMTERGSSGRTTVIAQSEVTSEETRVERKAS